MIPRITQDGPNIIERYWCGTCGCALPAPIQDKAEDSKKAWRFCPVCGEPIEYEKAQHVQWREQNCEHCGRPLIRKIPTGPQFFISTEDYVGASLCRRCLEEYCLQTNCVQCEIGKWPNCRYSYIKSSGLQRLCDNTSAEATPQNEI